MIPSELFLTTRFHEGAWFSAPWSGLSLTFTLSNLGSSCSINATVFISALMGMQEHSSGCDTPAISQEAPGKSGKVEKCSLDPLPAKVLKAKAVRRILRREIFLEVKTQISGFYLFLHWSFPDLTTSKQSPEQTTDIMVRYLHSVLSWLVMQNRKLPFAQLQTHKKVKLKMWLSTKPPLADIAT